MPGWRRVRPESGLHLTQSGFYDGDSESAKASRLGDQAYGRDTSGHIVAIYSAPDGKTVDDAAFKKKILDNLAQVEKDHPNQILRSVGYFKSPGLLRNMADASRSMRSCRFSSRATTTTPS